MIQESRHYQFSYGLLGQLDVYLKQNPELRCRDLLDLYYGLWYSLKDYTGTSTNFVGLSEFLVFRSLHHRLGGEQVNASETGRTLCFQREDMYYGREMKPDLAEYGSHEYDILLEQKGVPVAAVEIKVNFQTWVTTLDGTVGILEELHNRANKLKAAMIVFDSPTKQSSGRYSKLREAIEQSCRGHRRWLSIVILEDEEYRDRSFKDVLYAALGLGRFID